jgi:hypothetical protein
MAQNVVPPGPEDDGDFPEPPRLRALRRMVTALTVILALGMVVIAGTVAWRLWSAAPPARPVEAGSLAIPAGAAITAVGASAAEILVTTRGPEGGEALRVYRRRDGALLSVTPIERTD